MKESEAAQLLAIIAGADRRTVGEADAQIWAQALDGLDLGECARAIMDQIRESPEWITPAHIRSRVVARIRAQVKADSERVTYDEIVAAREAHDPWKSHEAFLDTRATFERAIREARARRDEIESADREDATL